MQNNKIFRSAVSLFMIFSVFVSNVLSIPAFASYECGFEPYSKGVYMVNLDTDIVVYEKNPHEKMVPASTAKILTALVVLENVPNLNKIADVPQEAFDEFWEGDPNKSNVSNAAIESYQDNLTYRKLLEALMIVSACEAANILAIDVGGSTENFARMMNETAIKAGAVNSNFTNAHGLYEKDNYTTPFDLYMITRYAYDNYPAFMEIAGADYFEMPANEYNPDGYAYYHTNSMMHSDSEYYYEGVKGIKTGSIDVYYEIKDGEATGKTTPGTRSLVTTAERGGYSYLLVTLEAPYYNDEGESSDYHYQDHIRLYNWAFSSLEYARVIEKGEGIADVPVNKGEDASVVTAVAAENFDYLLPKSLNATAIQQVKNLETSMDAPITKGQKLGTLTLNLGGEKLADIELIAKDGVELSVIADIKEKAFSIIDTGWFKAAVIVLVLLIVMLIISVNISKSRKKRKNDMMRRRGKIRR